MCSYPTIRSGNAKAFDGMSLSLGTCDLNSFLIIGNSLLGTNDTCPYTSLVMMSPLSYSTRVI